MEEDEEEAWVEDTTKEAQRCRMNEINEHAKVLTLEGDLERTVEECVKVLLSSLRKRKKTALIHLIKKALLRQKGQM